MKYAAAVNTNNFSSTYGREYISLSPKLTASVTYSEGFNLNSPKTLATKGFILSKSTIDNTTLLVRGQKTENPLVLSAKAKTSSLIKGYSPTAFAQGQSTPNQKKGENMAVTTQLAYAKVDKKSSSATKLKSDSYRPMSSTPKNGGSSIRVAESSRMKEEAGSGRWKKLEISTEFNNNTKNSYIAKSQTTKHTEVDDKNSVSLQQSIQAVQKSLQAKSMNTAGLGSPITQEKEEKGSSEIKFEQKFRSNRPASSSSSTKERERSLPRDKDSTKVNNFFPENYGNRTPKKGSQKTPSSAKKAVVPLEEEMSQSVVGSKKLTNSTNFDLRNSWQNTVNDSMRKDRRPLSAKKPATRDLSKDDVERTATSKGEKIPAQKVSLQAFVTKVNQGDVFSSIKKSEKKENSARKASQKPYLSLEDNKSKPIKDIETKGSKTTTNNDTKNFSVNLAKSLVNASAAPTQTMPPRNSKNTKSNGAAIKEGARTPSQELAARSVREKEPFIYYMTNLGRAHRWEGENDYFVQIYKEHFLQSFQALSFCKNLKLPDTNTIGSKKVNLPRRESHKGKKTLIFDMDETLIHCNESLDMPADVILPIVFPNGEVVEAGVNIRPYAVDILRELSQYYEIVVFTASHSCYANVVLDYLDPEGEYIHHRLFRESCVVTDEGVHIKDLRVIGNRNLQDMILIDNAAYSFCFQIENGIPIIPYYDNKADEELRRLIPYLKFLSSVKDLREINKQTFRLHSYTSYDSPDAVLERLIFQD